MSVLKIGRKKIIKSVFCVSIIIFLTISQFINTQLSHAAVSTLKDINTSSDFAIEAISKLVQNGVISGDENGYFYPHRTITRGEMVKMLVLALNIDVSSIAGRSTFKDVPEKHWANKYVEAAYESGIIKGISSDTFGVNNKCTREEMALMFVRSLGLNESDIAGILQLDNISGMADVKSISSWSKEAVEFSMATGLMKGTGGDRFSPKESAQREQAAVVLFRYLSNRESIDSVAKDFAYLKNGIAISINGETAMTDSRVVFENGELLVPAGFFEQMGADVNMDESKGVVKISRKASPDENEKNVFFKAGEKKAYLNYLSNNDPFEKAPSYAKKATLISASKVVDNEILVPAELVVKTLGAEYDWDEKAQSAAIQDTNTNKYPILYNAFKRSTGFKGEFNVSMSMILNERNSNESLKMDMQILGEADSINSHMTLNGTTTIPGAPQAAENSEIYIIGDKAYIRNIPNGEWAVTTDDEVQQGTFVPYYNDDNVIFLQNYKDLNLEKTGYAVVNGKIAAKYTITIDADDLDDFVSDADGNGMLELSQIYNNGFEMKVDTYLGRKGQLIRAAYRLTGGSKVEKIELTLNSRFIIDYIKSDSDIEITAPV